MPDVTLKDKSGNEINYSDVIAIQLDTPDGGTVQFKSGDAGSGSGKLDPRKPFRFYDPYGNIIYSYTKAEVDAMTELPPGPPLTGLSFDQWNYTLDELKTAMYFADIGPMYRRGSTPVTVLIWDLVEGLTLTRTFWFTFSGVGTIYINWGDGTITSESLNVSSVRKTISHTYAVAGRYIVTFELAPKSGYESNPLTVKFGQRNSSYYYNHFGSGFSGSPNSSLYYKTMSVSLRVISLLIGRQEYGGYKSLVGFVMFNAEQRLRFISLYKTVYDTDHYTFLQSPSLQAIAGSEKILDIQGLAFCGCTSLKRLRVNGTISEYVPFYYCDSLEDMMYGGGRINDNTMNSKWAMLMTSETPPAIGATAPEWGTKPIYVPDNAVETYKAAAGWSSAAAYILPASKYHEQFEE